MSIPSPLQQYHFHVILIWWHSPFKFIIVRSEYSTYVFLLIVFFIQFWFYCTIDSNDEKILFALFSTIVSMAIKIVTFKIVVLTTGTTVHGDLALYLYLFCVLLFL
jgi:hypothetical protein